MLQPKHLAPFGKGTKFLDRCQKMPVNGFSKRHSQFPNLGFHRPFHAILARLNPQDQGRIKSLYRQFERAFQGSRIIRRIKFQIFHSLAR